MASSLLRGDVGQFAATYADSLTSAEMSSDYCVLGRGVDTNRTVISQGLVSETVLGLPVITVVGTVATGLVVCDGLTIAPRALVNPCIGTGTFDAGGTVTIATSAAATTSFIFLTGRSAVGTLRVSAQTGSGFTVTSSDATDAAKTFSWFIVNPNYA